MEHLPHTRNPRGSAGSCSRALGVLLLASSSVTGWAQAAGALGPADIEAAYLYNFGKFVRFPAGAPQDTPTFAICILGEDGIGTPLDGLVANESIQGHKIVTRKLTAPAEVANCQIVYIGQSEEPRIERDLTALAGKPVLTVSSVSGFLERGGMIQFILQNKRVRFAVNLTAAERTHLELSSELLKVAVRVDAKPALEAK